MNTTAKQTTVIGAKIVEIRAMTQAEARKEGWTIDRIDGAPPVLVLDSGAILYPSRDVEGNGPGALFGREKSGACFGLRG